MKIGIVVGAVIVGIGAGFLGGIVAIVRGCEVLNEYISKRNRFN